MEPSFWHERWSKDEIGFHQPAPNEHLRNYAGELGVSPGQTVLVPLCGKSLDMLWLAEQGYRVCGIEISRRAVLDFFQENGLQYDVIPSDDGERYHSDRIDIFCTDFLDLEPDALPPIDGVYDRAALVALPPEMRPPYVRRLDSLIRPGMKTLVITLQYPQDEMKGPPFSVTGDEVLKLFGPRYETRQLHSADCLAREPRFREKGLSRLEEHVFLLSKSAPGSLADGL